MILTIISNIPTIFNMLQPRIDTTSIHCFHAAFSIQNVLKKTAKLWYRTVLCTLKTRKRIYLRVTSFPPLPVEGKRLAKTGNLITGALAEVVSWQFWFWSVLRLRVKVPGVLAAIRVPLGPSRGSDWGRVGAVMGGGARQLVVAKARPQGTASSPRSPIARRQQIVRWPGLCRIAETRSTAVAGV